MMLCFRSFTASLKFNPYYPEARLLNTLRGYRVTATSHVACPDPGDVPARTGNSSDLHATQQLLLGPQILLHRLSVAAVHVVELRDRQGLLIDGSVLGQSGEELAGHIKLHRLDVVLQLLSLLLQLFQLSQLAAQDIHHLRSGDAWL